MSSMASISFKKILRVQKKKGKKTKKEKKKTNLNKENIC